MPDKTRARFSVVIPTHNYGHYLATTIDSVFAQDRSDVELIVVDDASSDDTPTVVERYGDALIYVRLDQNVGPAKAWAIGLQIATGEITLKLDADDWQLSQCLDAFDRAFEQAPNVGMVAAAVYSLVEDTGRIRMTPVHAPVGVLSESKFRKLLLRRFFFHMPGVAIRSAAIEGHDPPRSDLAMAHDWEFFIRTMSGWSCVVLDEPVAVYRLHWKSVTRTARSSQTLRDDMLSLRDLALSAEAGLRLTNTESRTLLKGLTETYLRLTPLQTHLRGLPSLMDHLRFVALLSRTTERHYRQLIASLIGVAAAKARSRLMAARSNTPVELEALLPRPVPGTASSELDSGGATE